MNTTILRALAGLGAGLMFGIGLIISGMTDPNKVLAFLDVTGDWDPTLALVLASAMIPNLFVFAKILKRDKPVLDAAFHLPSQTKVTRSLVGGSMLFGIGWGLSGFCPGPAMVASLGGGSVLVFTVSMLAGTAIYRAAVRKVPATGAARANESNTIPAVLSPSPRSQAS